MTRSQFGWGGVACCLLLLAAPCWAAAASFEYDALGRLSRVTHSDGKVLIYRLDAAGNRTQVVSGTLPGVPASITVPSSSSSGSYTISWGAATGTVTAYELFEATNSSFSGQAQVYSGTALSAALSARAAGTYYYRVRACLDTECSGYRPGSNGTTVTQPTAIQVLNNIDFHVRCFRPTWFRDGLGRQTDFAYNTPGQLTERTDPPDADGVRRKTYVTYDTSTGISRPSVVRVCGDVTTCNTADEIRTEYQYSGNTLLPSLVRRIDAARGETRETGFTYDNAGRVLSEDGPLPGTADATFHRYDHFGRKEWEIGPADDSGMRPARRFTYRTADDKVAAIEEGAVPHETSTVLTVHRRVDNTYDACRNPVLEALSAGGSTYAVTQRDFDHRGQLTCETRRMNPGTFTALPGSACTLGTAGSFGPDRITRHTYDAAGQLLQVQRAYGTPIQQDYAAYTYSLNGQRQTIKDANSNLTTLEYDGFDRLAKMRFPVATSGANQSSTTDYEQYGYDTVGNRTSLRKRDGKTITFAFDALNRVWLKTVPTSSSGAPGYSVYYGYDVLGLQRFARFTSTSGAGVTNTYDGFGGLRSSSTNLDGVTRSVVSDYDAQGNRTRITHPDGVYFEYRYDPAGRLTQLTENGPSTPLALLTYDAQGRRDAIGRDTAGAATGFGYDAISRLGAIVHNLDGGGTSNDLTTTFAYNPASQIVTRAQSNSAYEFPVGSSNRAYVANGRNQYTQITGDAPATLTWDDNGNLISDGSTSFGYDTENRLTSASGAKSATLTYDPLGRLHQVTSAGVTTRFVYDGDQLIAEYNTAGTVQRRYLHGAAVDEPLVWYEGTSVSSASRRYLHADHQGSIIATSNAAGAKLDTGTYDAYGVTTAPSTWRFQYTGQAAIPQLGLYYYKARFYNPALGRFMQTDPIRYDDDLNLYVYAGNDPLDRTDPTGLYGMGTGWDDDSWKKFDKVQQRAASDMDKRADALDKKADKLDANGKSGGDAMRATAGKLRDGASALRSDGSDGKLANRVDAKTYQAMGGSESGAAFVKGNGPIMTVNGGNAAAWTTGATMSQWVVGHESLHTAGLNDQRGPNGAFAYKLGYPVNIEAFRAISGTDKANINPDSIMNMVYPGLQQ